MSLILSSRARQSTIGAAGEVVAPIRVLVVDDSAFMRQAISRILESESHIAVCGTARSGEEAVRKADELDPDIVTMDVEMPGMGGLQAVREIASGSDIPVIMVSALTQEGADITFRALEAGAVDFVAKPDAAYVNIRDVARDLIAKVRAFGVRPTDKKLRGKVRKTATAKAPPQRSGRTFECVAIGTSTGGPVALSKILPALPVGFAAPLIIVQHMPLGFTRPLAERLNATSSIHVLEAQNGMVLAPGRALVAPAGKHLTLRRTSGSDDVEVVLTDDSAGATHVPSVDRTMASVGEVYGPGSLGTILTGMGQDGVAGLRVLKDRGGYVIGEDEATCVVYGMPRAAAKAGLVDIVLPLDRVASALCELTNSSFARS